MDVEQEFVNTSETLAMTLGTNSQDYGELSFEQTGANAYDPVEDKVYHDGETSYFTLGALATRRIRTREAPLWEEDSTIPEPDNTKNNIIESIKSYASQKLPGQSVDTKSLCKGGTVDSFLAYLGGFWTIEMMQEEETPEGPEYVIEVTDEDPFGWDDSSMREIRPVDYRKGVWQDEIAEMEDDRINFMSWYTNLAGWKAAEELNGRSREVLVENIGRKATGNGGVWHKHEDLIDEKERKAIEEIIQSV